MMDVDGRRRTGYGRRLDQYTISSPCEPNGSGELIIQTCMFSEIVRPKLVLFDPSPLRKTKIYITNVDLVNDKVYTKFGLSLSIRSQDMEQKPNSDVKARNSVANLKKQ